MLVEIVVFERGWVVVCSGQRLSLHATPALKLSVQCASPRGGKLVGVCGVHAHCVGWRKEEVGHFQHKFQEEWGVAHQRL